MPPAACTQPGWSFTGRRKKPTDKDLRCSARLWQPLEAGLGPSTSHPAVPWQAPAWGCAWPHGGYLPWAGTWPLPSGTWHTSSLLPTTLRRRESSSPDLHYQPGLIPTNSRKASTSKTYSYNFS